MKKFIIIVRKSWAREIYRHEQPRMLQVRMDKPFYDILGFLGRAHGLRDEHLSCAGSPDGIAVTYAHTKKLWPKELTNEVVHELTKVNDHEEDQILAEAKLQFLVQEKLGLDLHFVDTWEEEAKLRVELTPC